MPRLARLAKRRNIGIMHILSLEHLWKLVFREASTTA
jgi:hypothetical protein